MKNVLSTQSLNVNDAIEYLELVRTEFNEKPHIYIEFLDIMREFKSAAIGTEDVIERVTLLFGDRVDIILGFNTFLPSGFVIEYLHGENGRNIIVKSPSGRRDFMLPISEIPTTSLATTSNYFVMPAQLTTTSTEIRHLPPGNYYESTSSQNASEYISRQRQQYIPNSIPVPMNQHQHIPAPIDNQQSQQHTPTFQLQQNQVGRRSQEQISFNEAIEYVNKIKTRYATEPDIYKEFLGVLQAYQHEEISNLEVGSRIQRILQKSPDLLSEFIGQFLPSCPGPTNLTANENKANMETIASGSINVSVSSEPLVHVISSDALAVNEVLKVSNIATDMNLPSSSSIVNLPNIYNAKKRRNEEDNVSTAEKAKKKKSKISPTLITNPPIIVANSVITNEEFTFFKRVKEFLGPASPGYQDFLKILALYSRQILNEQLTIDRMKIIFGDDGGDELLADFKKMIQYSEKQDPEPIHKFSANASPVVILDLDNCKPCGPSYRMLPKEYDFQNMLSTNMDEVAREVLNDKWVSYPKCESEEQHIAQRRNVYAEAMNQCEEERYEFDLFMESLSLTIKTLEPIKRKISTMTPQEKFMFKLQPGLGGKSFVYQRVIKKLYDGERCNEVLDALYQNPAMAVPVILRRLKQKHEEWRKAQINWNKIWREINHKNYYKSLDFQGNTFKYEDKKKTLNTKTMLNEIEQLYQQSKINDTFQKCQYKYTFNDPEVLRDAVTLLRIYLYESERYDVGQCKAYCDFVKSLISNLFGLPSEFFVGHRVSNEYWTRIGDGASLPEIDSDRIWTQISDSSRDQMILADSRIGDRPKCFFGNNYFYYFMRLFQVLYSRLETLKNLPRPIRNDIPDHIPHAVIMGLRKCDSKLSENPYEELLDLIIKYLKSSKETTTIQFEECVYRIFPTKGYVMFTIKKLLQSIVKEIQNIEQSKSSNELWALYKKHKDTNIDNDNYDFVGKTRSLLKYQIYAREIIGDSDHMFRIECHKKVVSIAFCGFSSLILEEDWSNYLYSYVSVTTTEGVDLRNLKMPFLRRNFLKLGYTNVKKPTKWQKNNLELSISRESSKIIFIDGSEDCFVSPNFGYDEKTVTAVKFSRNKRTDTWRTWLSVVNSNIIDG
ncbi:5719_t:CDS:10 [Ambispora gerdemannii]|uniref:5719_t:CDS:1 n=1 Tax=Ambispora gerdemannii TaxID=144530 RepID=A0A9N8W8C6_9GLOM|nr:5719_t:CDS:10 [Ambispora gerdemannii]